MAHRNVYEAVLRAVRRGALVRPDSCEDCGESVKVEAHHEDYSKPLDVIWLCRPCHGVRHHPRLPAGWIGDALA